MTTTKSPALPNVAVALTWARAQLLAAVALPELTTAVAALEAECLLCFCLQKPRRFCWSSPSAPLSAPVQAHFVRVVRQRATGYPLAYITGECEFWSLPLSVNESVLIPRPETEHVIEHICQLFADVQSPQHVLELGTGSGAIACALASERPTWRITAVDCSHSALVTAKRNAQRLSLTPIDFRLSDWFSALAGESFDLIVANPPYLSRDDSHLVALSFEPLGALVAGASGMEAYAHIITHAPRFLCPNGVVVLEHGLMQHEIITNLLKQNSFSDIRQMPDLQGIMRVISAKMG